jgi:hypothetical protein
METNSPSCPLFVPRQSFSNFWFLEAVTREVIFFFFFSFLSIVECLLVNLVRFLLVTFVSLGLTLSCRNNGRSLGKCS